MYDVSDQQSTYILEDEEKRFKLTHRDVYMLQGSISNRRAKFGVSRFSVFAAPEQFPSLFLW